MRKPIPCAVVALVFAASLRGQQSEPPQRAQRAAPPAQGQQEPLKIYRIDLDPTGAELALGKPRLKGDTYVYRAWPNKAIVRMPKVKVRKITRVTKDLSKEVVYEIDLIPSGKMIAREKPKLQRGAYVFHAFKDGAFMSLRQSDVQKVTRVMGLPAFKLKQQALGVVMIGDLPMEGGIGSPSPAAAPASQSPARAPSNWIYQGKPGVTDAYAPAPATQAYPGDVPKAPEPAPTPSPH